MSRQVKFAELYDTHSFSLSIETKPRYPANEPVVVDCGILRLKISCSSMVNSCILKFSNKFSVLQNSLIREFRHLVLWKTQNVDKEVNETCKFCVLHFKGERGGSVVECRTPEQDKSLSKTLYSPKVLVNYPGSDGSVPT